MGCCNSSRVSVTNSKKIVVEPMRIDKTNQSEQTEITTNEMQQLCDKIDSGCQVELYPEVPILANNIICAHISLYLPRIEFLQLQQMCKKFYAKVMPILQERFERPNLLFFAYPESKQLRNTLLVVTEFMKGKPIRVVHEGLDTGQHRFIQVGSVLYSLSFGDPMKLTMYSDPQSPHTIQISDGYLKLNLRGFAVACWDKRFLYISGGFAPGGTQSS